jgi:hypothetical protein
LRHLAQDRQGHETLAQIARRHRPNVANTQAEQQARRIGLALGLNGVQQVIHRLILPPFAPDNIGAASVQAENVRRAFQPAKVEKFDDRLFAQTFNVQRATADKMLEPFGPLRRANQAPGAANIDLPSSATASDPHSGQ